jgi:hypothetical protein
VKTKKLAGAAAVGAVTAVTTLLLGATPAFAQDGKNDNAFALEASGLIDINPISAVESTDGKLVHDELLSIGDVAGAHEDDLSFGLLTAEAEAHRAESVVKEVNVLNLLRADVIRTWCKNGKGGLQVINGTILGKKIPDTSVPGHDLDISPLVKLSLNDQKRHADGSLTVTGIELKVLPAAGNLDETLSSEEKAALPVLGELLGKPLNDGASTVREVVDQLGAPLNLGDDVQTITIGSATCTEGASGSGDETGGNGDGKDDDGDGDGKDDDGKGDDKDDDGKGKDDDGKGNGSEVKSAPAPSVVQAALPVTG